MLITIDDIRNPIRISGFDHVGRNDGGGSVQKPFQADVYGGSRDKAGRRWKGPRRATAEEAAQDYCDFINGNPRLSIVPSLKSAGHKGKRDQIARDPEIEAALGVLRDARGERNGKQGYVYLIGAERAKHHPILQYAVKVGFSTNPEARVAELQTGNPMKLCLYAKVPGTRADEQALHEKYAHANILQEWFRPTVALLSEFSITSHRSLSA